MCILTFVVARAPLCCHVMSNSFASGGFPPPLSFRGPPSPSTSSTPFTNLPCKGKQLSMTTIIRFYISVTIFNSARLLYVGRCCHVYILTDLYQDRYQDFHRTFRIWRHLKSLKHAGRGLDPGGASTTSQGQLVLECPACPHPSKNLPLDWEDLPREKQ